MSDDTRSPLSTHWECELQQPIKIGLDHEVYLGSVQSLETFVPAIYKYSNSDAEYSILKYLHDCDSTLRIPKLYEYRTLQQSPSGKVFRACVVMEYIKPALTFPMKNGFKYVVEPATRLAMAKSLIPTVQKLHDLDIYHRDVDFGNVVIAADGECYLIDFDAASSEKNEQFKQTTATPNLGQDNFGLLSIAGCLATCPEDWKTMPTKDLVQLLP